MEQEVTFDVKGLLARFGGPQAFRTACVAAGVKMPAYTAVRQWVSRNSAPGHSVALMMYVASKTFRGFNPYGYVVLHPAREEEEAA